ncbi:hypothetical protein LWE61_15765 [Sphingobium sufflavum]|uniref:hypothetical protein n=1 Tax=Sphingobium sufflavum TaxID=1129547 RepID=UPI001F41CD99|nr:hypothetical protein [Sphingobium sufflavum]MCE7798005.1 hypothetical protein [Sphingobium sufflavum]
MTVKAVAPFLLHLRPLIAAAVHQQKPFQSAINSSGVSHQEHAGQPCEVAQVIVGASCRDAGKPHQEIVCPATFSS